MSRRCWAGRLSAIYSAGVCLAGVGKNISESEAPQSAPVSFAETALSGENQRRREEQFARPARQKFKRHVVLFLVANLLLGAANLIAFPEHVVFYVLTIVWAFVLADNFVWAFVVDPDRDVAERGARRADRVSNAEHGLSAQVEVNRDVPGSLG